MLNTSVYNGKEQRIRRTDAGQTNGDYTMYFYMGGALAFSTNSDANYITDENIIDPNGTIIAGKRQDNVYNPNKPEGQYWIYHYDARGSVTNIIGTNASGALYRAENNVYDAFGKDDSGSATPTTSIKNEVKFTGAVQDSNGLYYLSSRHYDPNTGRFLQQDTVSGDPYSPWTQNLYTYTSNNPTNYTDPTGHWLFQAVAGAIGGLFRMGAKAVTNVVQGKPVFDGVIAAGIGGAVEGAVFASTFKPRLASMAGSAAESAANEAGDYLSGKKELTWENVGESALNIGKDVAVDAAAGWVTKKVGLDYKPYKINKGWFQPKSFKSYIFGSYGQKMTANQLAAALQNMPADLFRGETTAFAPGERVSAKSTKRGGGSQTGNRTNGNAAALQAAEAAVQAVMDMMKWMLSFFH